MEEVVEWLAELGEAGGRGGEAVRRFAALFPPSTRWGEPWPPGLGADDLPPFRPDARSYAAALREVLAGRRRVRLAGRWDDGAAATLTLSLAGVGDGAAWTILEATGLA